ncbi:MAG: glycosyltransferase family 4 protein [Streptosporangiaceae bacterium]
MACPPTLVVTNDFPPRPGGIQAFVHALVSRQPQGSVVVYAPSWQGAERFDAGLDFPVVRHPTSLMLPVPAVARRARAVARAEGCGSVLLGAAFPLGLLASGLRTRGGVERVVGLTHGHEAGWAGVPGARRMLRRIGDDIDVLTHIGAFTAGRLAGAISPEAARRMVRLPPGVDETVFRPGAGGEDVRKRYGLSGRPVVVCVSRLVARKGQDMLIRAWPRVLRAVPDAALLIVGDGPAMGRLGRLADRLGVRPAVRFTGQVAWGDLAAHYAAGDVFAMPCRTRLAGLDVEGLGMVYLEAAATGLPVVAGASGGAPEAVVDGETGYIVDGIAPEGVAETVVGLLRDPELRLVMGRRGRAWVERAWRWDVLATRLRALLDGSA